MEVFLVYVDTDPNEGKGPFRIKDVWANEDHARQSMEAEPDPWGRTNRKWDSTNTHFGHMYYESRTVITEGPLVMPRYIVARERLIQGVFDRLSQEERRALANQGWPTPDQ